jgi:hypothetical protein
MEGAIDEDACAAAEFGFVVADFRRGPRDDVFEAREMTLVHVSPLKPVPGLEYFSGRFWLARLRWKESFASSINCIVTRPVLTSLHIIAAAGLCLLALPACSTTPSSAVEQKNPTRALRKGMTPAAVRAVMGEPVEVVPLPAPEGTSERWLYRQLPRNVVEQKVTGTQEIPYVDPITGQQRMIPEPVYSNVTTTIVEEIHLLWFNGELISWTTQRKENRSIHG